MQIETVELTSRDDAGLEYTAKLVAEALAQAYPAHFWAIGFQGGAVVVKNMAIGANYGMVLPEHYSASDLKRNAILMAGELLERAGLPRGAWTGEMAGHLEGSDPQFFKPMHMIGRG